MALLPLIRMIETKDNEVTADLIRQVMTEFMCVGPGYSIEDTELEDLYSTYQEKQSAFYVIELGGEILGTGGFAPLAGADGSTCELRKMYFSKQLRGLGIGRKLLQLCIDEARKCGFQHMYLETVERMEAANRLYQKNGFTPLKEQKGATGHGGCDTFYQLEL